MSLSRRFDVTGLEEPEELWDRLNDATAQVQALTAGNKSLRARVRQLERQLSEVGGLTDDELVAELPRRMIRALESAQSVAAEIVRRAHQQEAAIVKKANASAADLWNKVQAEAEDIRRRTTADAATHVEEANVEARRVVSEAQTRRDQMIAQFREQSVKYERHIRLLQDHHARLAGAYDVVERTLTLARHALAGSPNEGGAISPPEQPSPDLLDPAGDADTTGRKPPVLLNDATVTRPVVYDWSPTALHDT